MKAVTSKVLSIWIIALLILGLCASTSYAHEEGQADAPSSSTSEYAPLAQDISTTRLAGDDRYGTMQKIVSKGFSRSDTVIVATGDSFPDALAASPLAGIYDAPIILTSSMNLSPQAEQAIRNLRATKAFVIGGESAVSKGTVTSIKNLGVSVTRIAGKNRVETACDIYAQGKYDWGSTAIVVTSAKFADALSISSYAYANYCPIFLVDNSLTSAHKKALKNFDEVIICGSEASVNWSIQSQIERLGCSVTRLAGADRYATSKVIADFAIRRGMVAEDAGVASGEGFPDALAGSSLCGRNYSALLLVSDATASDMRSTLTSNGAGHVYVFGGPSSVSDDVVTIIRTGRPPAPEPPKPDPTTPTTVYITKSGTKYHLEWCTSLRKSKIAISLADAKARGYTPCKVCNPPS